MQTEEKHSTFYMHIYIGQKIPQPFMYQLWGSGWNKEKNNPSNLNITQLSKSCIKQCDSINSKTEYLMPMPQTIPEQS